MDTPPQTLDMASLRTVLLILLKHNKLINELGERVPALETNETEFEEYVRELLEENASLQDQINEANSHSTMLQQQFLDPNTRTSRLRAKNV